MHMNAAPFLPPSFLSLSLLRQRHTRGGAEEGKETYLISTSVPVLRLFSISEMTAFKMPKMVSVPRVSSGHARMKTSRAANTLPIIELEAESRNFSANSRTTGITVALTESRVHAITRGKEREGTQECKEEGRERERQMSMRNMEGFAAEIGCKSSVTVRSKTDEGGRTGAPVLIQRISFIFSR